MNNFLEYDERYGMPTIDEQQQAEERREYEDAWRMDDAKEDKAQSTASVELYEDESQLPF